MTFTCVECQEEFESEFVPALDLRTGGAVCPDCDEERRDWRARLVFPDPTVRMAEVDNSTGEAF